jgi:hypothetical protein
VAVAAKAAPVVDVNKDPARPEAEIVLVRTRVVPVAAPNSGVVSNEITLAVESHNIGRVAPNICGPLAPTGPAIVADTMSQVPVEDV